MDNRKRVAIYIGKWILSIALVFCLILVSIGWYLSRNWKPLLDKQLKELVISSSDSLYHIEYSDLNISIVTGNISIQDFKLIPDTAVYHKLESAGKAPDNMYDLSVANLILRNFHPRRLYSDKKLNINAIIIDKPTLVITNRRHSYNDTISDKRTIYQKISKIFTEIRIEKVNLNDIDFSFINKSNAPEKKTSIKNLNVNIRDIVIDSLSQNSPDHLYYSRDIGIVMKDYKIATPDSLYYLTLDKLSFSTEDRKLTLDKMSLTPRYNTEEFYKKTGYAKDRFDIDFKSIVIDNIDIRHFARDQKLYAQRMDLGDASVKVYNNNSYPHRRSDRTGQFPHQQLQRLALDLKIDTLNLKNAFISYSEFDKTSHKTGKITFEHTEGKFYNLTNDSAAVAKNHIMKAALRSKVMNSGKLNVNFTFNLSDKAGAFTYDGVLGPVNGRELNKITEPLGMISVKTASVKRLKFSAKANENVSRGSVEFLYDDLKVQILKRDEVSGDLKKQGFLSGLANTFVIHTSNPDRKGVITPGIIYFERPVTQSFFSFLWQSLFTGIKGSVGVDKEKETRIRKTVTNVSSFIQNLKENAAANKQKRQEKREERKKEKELKR